MNDDGRPRDEELLRCPSCDGPHDIEDNYCRHCGASLYASRVPMLRDEQSYSPVAWRETLPVVARGAAVVAAGTLAEAILRRLIGRALRGLIRPSGGQARQSARHRTEKAEVIERPEPAAGDDHVVTETFLFRRVWLRRRTSPDE